MSLDDRLNPNDGSFIDWADASLLSLNKSLAEFWQNKSYKNKDALARSLHGLSAGGFITLTAMIGVYFTDPILSFVEGTKCILGIKTSCTGLESEILSESIGLPRKTVKFIDVCLYGAGALGSTLGVGSLAYGIATRDEKVMFYSAAFLVRSLAILSWSTADYLDKIDASDPPKKPKRKPLWERLKEKLQELSPQPIPEPAYASTIKKIAFDTLYDK